jgi:WD40 repeat protein
VLSQDGETLASGAGDRALRTWNVLECCPAMNVPAGDGTVAGVCFHPSASQLAVAGFSSSLKIVDASTGQISRELACPCADVRAVTISPDGQRLAAAGRNGTVRIWNAADGTQERDIETDGRCIRALAFSPDGRYLAAAGTSPSIRVFDTSTGGTTVTFSTRPAKCYSLVFLDNNRLAAGGTDNRILIWDLTSRQAVSQLVGHTGTVAALATCRGGTTLVSGSYDTTVRIWDLVNENAPATAARAATKSPR